MNQLFQPSIDIDYLYQLADKDNDGVIGSTESQEFFQYTHLNRLQLSLLWSFCVPPKQPMDKESFILALRCIYYLQQGKELSIDTIELLQQDQQPYHSPSLDCPFLLSSDQFNQLEISFKQITEKKSYTISKNQFIKSIQSKEDRQLFQNEKNIETIMNLSDLDKDNELNYCEYVIALSCIHYYKLFNSFPSSIP